jgi:hypothetical protein
MVIPKTMNHPTPEKIINILPQFTTEEPESNQPNQDNQPIYTLEELVQILELLANTLDQ